MKLGGRRIHIAGSANSCCNPLKLKYAHQLVKGLSNALLTLNASLCVQVGREPFHNTEESLATIFDWSVIQSVYEHIESTSFDLNAAAVLPLTTVITEKTASHIPTTREAMWQTLVEKHCIEILSHPRQWTAGAVRRDRIASVGDVLILVSGGEGVEHLAQLYVGQRKPVIAFDLDLGASTEIGSGRAVAINRAISSYPLVYLSPKRPETIAALWENISTKNGTRSIQDVVKGVLSLLEALEPPSAFCVRLLNPTSANFESVDDFFTNVVNPVIGEMDYRLVVSPQSPDESRWMNEQIFRGIHESEIVIVDLTDERPNCLIELGYALGRNRRVFVCAKESTMLPFDVDKIECFFWSPTADWNNTKSRFLKFVKRNLTQPPLVPTVTLV